MNTENILYINKKDLEIAKIICAAIEDDDIRNRAVANTLAAKIATNYLGGDFFKIDEESGLHNLCKVLQDIDISDIYIDNSYVDIRVCLEGDSLSIPFSHVEYGIKPVLYMFIRISPDLTKAEVLGFIEPENISTSRASHGICPVREGALKSFYNITSSLQNHIDEEDVSDDELYGYADDSINNKYEIIKKLTKSVNSRHKLASILKAQCVLPVVPIPQENQIEDKIIENEEPENTQTDVLPEEELLDLIQETEQEQNTENMAESGDNTEQNSENINLGNDKSVDDTAIENAELQTEESDDLIQALEYSTETTPSSEKLLSNNTEDGDDSNEQIDSLFNSEEEQAHYAAPNKNNGIVVLITVLVLLAGICGGAYWLFSYVSNNFLSKASLPANVNSQIQDEYTQPESGEMQKDEGEKTYKQEAMPIETVETKQEQSKSEIGNSVAVPEIEHDLDASILVSNLKIDWEVPSGYASNTAAKRYLIKLGKIIQLNLKTELLLLNRPPISNKIEVELTYDSSTGKYTVVGFIKSSGEKSVDDVIMTTVKQALSMNLSTSTEAIGKLQGNPILIIHL